MNTRQIAELMYSEIGGCKGNIGSSYARIMWSGSKQKPLPKNKVTLYITNGAVELKLLPFVPGKRNHRCYVHCGCGVWVPSGRLYQHKCKPSSEVTKIFNSHEYQGDEVTCPYCGGQMVWCTGCEMYSQVCCEEYGTCECS